MRQSNLPAPRTAIPLMLLFAGLPSPAAARGSTVLPVGLHTTQLKCEHLIDPLGVEAPQPRLSWVLESKERGQLQTAYQIVVASSLKQLEGNDPDKWDSGKIVSDRTIEVPYKGSALASGERCYWKVRS
jgi:hypothetical protein